MSFETKIKSISIFGVILAGLLYLLSVFPWIAVTLLLWTVSRTVLKYKSFPIGQPAHATKQNFTQSKFIQCYSRESPHTHTHIFYSIFHTTGSNSRDIEPKVVIIGAGPAGLAVSIAYLKETFCVTFTFCFLSYNRLQVQFKRKEFLVLFLKKNPQSLRHGTAISTRFILLS